MPIVSIDHEGGTFRHRCGRCGYEDDLSIDPAHGHVAVHAAYAGAPPEHAQTLMTRPCPHCLEHGVGHGTHPLLVEEAFRLNIPSWEAGEGTSHPGSMLGTRLPGPHGEPDRNIVSEHVVGYHLGAVHVTQARLIRALQQHPHLTPHAPLQPDPPHLPGHPHTRWDGAWRPDPGKGAR